MSIKTPILQFVWNRYGKATPKKEAVVELRVTYERKQKYISTNIRLLPKHWRNGSVVNRPDAMQLNQLLDKFLVDVRKVIMEMMNENNVDIFAISDRLERMHSGEITFIEYCCKRAEIRSFHKSEDSVNRYERFMRKFMEWGKIEYWEDISDENIIEFDHYLEGKGMKPYSKWQNYHRFLNSFILDAISEGLLRRNPYKSVQIVKEKSKTGIGKYLTPDEFERVKNAHLSSVSMERVRDLFVFQTYTCMAYTDLAAFDAGMIQVIKGMKVYCANRNKTDQTFTIPLLPQALSILEKYKNKLPIISNVKYNEYLKVVAQAAGIDKPVSSHWARHTGATLLLNLGGLDMKIVSKICGHSSTRITEKVYAKLLDESVVDAVSGIKNKL